MYNLHRAKPHIKVRTIGATARISDMCRCIKMSVGSNCSKFVVRHYLGEIITDLMIAAIIELASHALPKKTHMGAHG